MKATRYTKAVVAYSRKIGQALASLVKGIIFTGGQAVATYFVGLTANWSKPTYSILMRKAVRNPYSFRAISLIANTMGAIVVNLKVQQPGADGKPEDVPDHPLLKLIKKPNSMQGTSDFFKQAVWNLFGGGEMIMWNLGLFGTFRPTSIQLIRPDRIIQLVHNRDTGEVVAYKGVDKFNRPIQVPAEEVCFLKQYDPLNDDRGLPLLLPLLQTLDLFDNQLDWMGSVSQHKGRIPGWFVSPHQLDDGPYNRMKEELQATYSRDSTSSMPMLLEDGLKFQESGMSPTDAGMQETMIQLMRMIAVGIGVDPALLGDNANKTYSNFSEAVRALIQLATLPLLDWMLDQINAWYMERFDTPDAKLVYDEADIKLLREDLDKKAARLVTLVAGIIMTPDEARESMKLEPVGGTAAQLLAKVGTVPLEQAGLSVPLDSDEDAAAAASLLEDFQAILKSSARNNGHTTPA